MSASRTLAAAVALGVLLLAAAARAQGSPDHDGGHAPKPPREADSRRAEALFSEAQACLDRGDWTCACDKFARSVEAEPSASTELNIAKCRDHDGKPALAMAAVQEALRLNRTAVYADEARRAKLDEYAGKMLAQLAPRVARLRVAVSNPPAGTEVHCDADLVSAAALDEPLTLDPGAHELVVNAPGRDAERRTITLAPGEEQAVAFVYAKPLAPAPRGVEPPPPKAQAPTAVAPPSPSGALRLPGLTLGGFGLATLGAGGVLGIVTLVKSNAANGSAACQSSGNATLIVQCNGLRDAARSVQAASIATAVVGGVALGTGVALFATASRASPAPTRASAPALAVVVCLEGVAVTGRY